VEAGVPRNALSLCRTPWCGRPAVASFWPHWRGHRQCARFRERVDFIGPPEADPRRTAGDRFATPGIYPAHRLSRPRRARTFRPIMALCGRLRSIQAFMLCRRCPGKTREPCKFPICVKIILEKGRPMEVGYPMEPPVSAFTFVAHRARQNRRSYILPNAPLRTSGGLIPVHIEHS
jgi:hypothetical protein